MVQEHYYYTLSSSIMYVQGTFQEAGPSSSEHLGENSLILYLARNESNVQN